MGDVHQDWDCQSGGGPEPTRSFQEPTTRTTFNHKGMEVDELTFRDWKPGKTKIVWVRAPFEYLGFERVDASGFRHFDKSPCFHHDYPNDDTLYREVVVEKIREAFEGYWGLPDKPTMVETKR